MATTWTERWERGLANHAAQLVALKLGRQIRLALLESKDPKWVARQDQLREELVRIEAELVRMDHGPSTPGL
jgi:hypothetical protein